MAINSGFNYGVVEYKSSDRFLAGSTEIRLSVLHALVLV